MKKIFYILLLLLSYNVLAEDAQDVYVGEREQPTIPQAGNCPDHCNDNLYEASSGELTKGGDATQSVGQ